jgi:NDP-sugar pyrophosphorylase family protein
MDTAILLAAGAGSRFWPYNEVRHKSTIPIMNKPAIRRLAEGLREAGFTRLVVVVGQYENSVRAALQDFEVPIAFVRQSMPAGTTTAVLNAMPLVGNQPVLVVYADGVMSPDNYKNLVKTFTESGAIAACLVQELEPEHDPRDWIGAQIDKNMLKRVEGHSTDNTHRLAGAYCLQHAAVRALQGHPGLMSSVPVGGMPPVEAELAQCIQMLMDEGHEIPAVSVQDFFVDLDKPWHIWEANVRWLHYESERLQADQIHSGAQIDDSAEIEGRLVIEDGAQIGKRVVIKGNAFIGKDTQILNGAILDGTVCIGERTRISDYCLVSGGTTIGNGCIVGHDAEMEGVMLDGSFLYHYCEIMGVVGQKVDIGAATVCGTLRFDDDDTVHKVRGRRERPEWGANGTYFGDFSRTGVNVITMPGVKIGAYSCVGAGAVVYEDIPSRKLVLLKQELIMKDWGPERYGW